MHTVCTVLRAYSRANRITYICYNSTMPPWKKYMTLTYVRSMFNTRYTIVARNVVGIPERSV